MIPYLDSAVYMKYGASEHYSQGCDGKPHLTVQPNITWTSSFPIAQKEMGNLKLMNGRTRHIILPVSYFPLKLLPFPSPWKTVGENAAGREFPRGIAARKKWLSTCLLPLLQSISKNILQWRKDHYAHMRLQRNIQDLDHINPSSETKSETPQLLWFTGIQPHFHLWTLLFFKR